MQERRQHPRQSTPWPLDVHDLSSGLRLGRIADLSNDGFMIFSETEISSDCVIQCQISCSNRAAEIEEIHLGADCLWSRPGAGGQHGWAGFHIIDIADDQMQRLTDLLERL